MRCARWKERAAGIERAIYLEAAPRGDVLYVVDFNREWAAGGSLVALAIDPTSGDLR